VVGNIVHTGACLTSPPEEVHVRQAQARGASQQYAVSMLSRAASASAALPNEDEADGYVGAV
jgi:hypothetical protein